MLRGRYLVCIMVLLGSTFRKVSVSASFLPMQDHYYLGYYKDQEIYLVWSLRVIYRLFKKEVCDEPALLVVTRNYNFWGER